MIATHHQVYQLEILLSGQVPSTLLPSTLVPSTLLPSTLLPTSLLPGTLLHSTLLPTSLLPSTLLPSQPLDREHQDQEEGLQHGLLQPVAQEVEGHLLPAWSCRGYPARWSPHGAREERGEGVWEDHATGGAAGGRGHAVQHRHGEQGQAAFI